MNILLIAKLANHTLRENILSPLLRSKEVDTIYVLRDVPGDVVDNRVVYLCPKRKQGLMHHVEKIIKGICYCRQYRIDAVIGVLLTPHGYIGKLISMLTHRPYIHVTIAGHREFWVDGKRMERLNVWLAKHSYAVTVTGEQTRNYLQKKRVSDNKIYILPNLPNALFLDRANTSVTFVEVEQRKYDIVSFSRIDKNKNLGLLLRALKQLTANKQMDVMLIIAGDGPELEAIKAQSGELGIEAHIHFAGYVSDIHDKMRAYSESKIFVSCSKGEGFPVSLLEAMCCGCIPVVSNVGDIVDAIEEDVYGFVFNDTDDETELTDILYRLLQQPTRLKELSEKAREINTMMSIDNNGKVWDKILSGIKTRSR
jgi:glycosyltransferase involved in cell wall biosynthesis